MAKKRQSNRRRVYQRGCFGKVRYRDHDEAIRALRYVKAKPGRAPSRAYWCPVCKGYHLTSKETA